MKVRSAAILLALLSVVVLSGCMTAENYSVYRAEMDQKSFLQCYADTWKDWFLDLSDVLSLEFSAGEGFGVEIQATKIVHGGFLFADVMKLGYRDRGLGFYREVRKEGGFSWFYYRDMEFEPLTGTYTLWRRQRLMQDFTLRHNTDRHWADVGYEFHLIFGGNSLFVSPLQIFDFAGSTLVLPYNLLLRVPLGKAGFNLPEFDLADDDASSAVRDKHNVDLIRSEDDFPPGEVLDDLMRLGY